MLKKLDVRNYKSLREVDVTLPRFCTLVGANAAGKSNFADAIEFLSLVARNGLPAAVTEKGGYENLCFRRARRAKSPVRFHVEVEPEIRLSPLRSNDEEKETQFELRFEFTFAFRAAKEAISSEFSVVEERLCVRSRTAEPRGPWEQIALYEYSSDKKPHHRVETAADSDFILPDEILREILKDWVDSPRDDLFFTSRLKGLPPFPWLTEELARYRVFQVSPAYTRAPASASGSLEMAKNGGNLAAAIHALSRKEPDALGELLEYVQLAVPSVEAIETDYVRTRELGLFLREKDMGRRAYASELSDGTLRTISLFLPLVDPRCPLVVIEEPENCIHPWVVRQFVEAARESSQAKQIILTTHSPVLVSRLKPEELFIVERRQGQTTVRPAIEVDISLDRIIREGITDLGSYWDSGAMRAVPTLPSLFDDTGK